MGRVKSNSLCSRDYSTLAFVLKTQQQQQLIFMVVIQSKIK